MVCFSDVANIWPEQPSFIVECNLFSFHVFSRWKNFKRQMLNMRSHSDSKGFELKRPNDSIYSFPCPDCMCHRNKTEDSRSSSATWFTWAKWCSPVPTIHKLTSLLIPLRVLYSFILSLCTARGSVYTWIWKIEFLLEATLDIIFLGLAEGELHLSANHAKCDEQRQISVAGVTAPVTYWAFLVLLLELLHLTRWKLSWHINWFRPWFCHFVHC